MARAFRGPWRSSSPPREARSRPGSRRDPRLFTPTVLTLRTPGWSRSWAIRFPAPRPCGATSSRWASTVESESAEALDVRGPGTPGLGRDPGDRSGRGGGADPRLRRLPARSSGRSAPTRCRTTPCSSLEDELRERLAGRGLFEAQTPSFVPRDKGTWRSNPAQHARAARAPCRGALAAAPGGAQLGPRHPGRAPLRDRHVLPQASAGESPRGGAPPGRGAHRAP